MRLVASNNMPPHVIKLDTRTDVCRVLGEHARTLCGALVLAVDALAHLVDGVNVYCVLSVWGQLNVCACVT